MRQLVNFVFISMLITGGDTSKILGVFPIASSSHQIVFRTLTHELAKRGHELVIITPIPSPEKPENVTEISTGYLLENMTNSLKNLNGKRGVILQSDFMTIEKLKILLTFPKAVLKQPDFINLVKNGSEKFDLIIGETYYYFPLLLAKKYDAPMIWFTSFYALTDNFEVMGAPARHPILNPSFYRNRVYNLSLWEKLYEIYVEVLLSYQFRQLVQMEEAMMKDAFGDDTSVPELKNYVDLLFINANPIFEGNRAVSPNIVYLGGIHMKPVKKLSEDLQTYLDSSERGVVYVSLGTNVKFSNMDKDLVQAFVDGLAALPYDILFKFDTEDLPYKPKNMRIQKWFPQRDLLFHPNIKAFVTQCGLQSTDEAIDAGVPVIGLPFFGDQFFNAEQYVRLGIGVKVDVETMTAEDLTNAVNIVIDDERYHRNMEKLGNLLRDQPQTPLERAVWWTEYVIRHRGAKHLRPLGANVSWTEYLMIDVVAFMIILITGITTALFFFIKVTVCKVLRMCSRFVKWKKS